MQQRRQNKPRQALAHLILGASLGIGIEETNAGIGVPAYIISVRYRTKQMPDCVGLVRYRISSGVVSFYHSGTGLIRCRTVRPFLQHTHTNTNTHANTHKNTHTHGHGQAAWTLTWTCSMEMGTMDMDKQHGCRNADEKFSLASLVFC
jgi:hypothetical protein